MPFERYAIFWAPRADDPLAVFEHEWFGRSANASENCKAEAAIPAGENAYAQPHEPLGLEAELAARATRIPSRYALHGTMKAPFRPREGVELSALLEAMAAFCARRRRVVTGKLRLHRFPRFLALVLDGGTAELDWLADSCVTHFDHFRSPLNDEDRVRRGQMSSAEAILFEQFGYHYIFNNFTFHITLAGPLDEPELDAVKPALAAAVAPVCEEPFVVDNLCLFGDPGQGAPFKLVERFPLM
ncbi:MAG: DUF1045 domain-containing protein [Alphaproteobacteria bacterium]